MSFRNWSMRRILSISLVWAAAILLLMPWPSASLIRGYDEQGRLFLTSTTFDPTDVLKLACWAGLPPLVLFAVWRLQRR